MRRRSLLLLIAAGFTLTACADFYSIGRRTTLPDAPTSNKGLAIHLDAQQRLMMVGRDGTYCAEASPDAMAAYAAALAASVSAQGYGSGSASNASQSNIASIGLRTQSITLMRDALYRLCEAGANGQLSKISATQLMARSQDLTAVVVAVEQLTGAVAANQAILTGTSNASASASMIGDAEQLDIANKNLEKKTEAKDKTQAALDAKKAEVAVQQPKAAAAETAVTDAPADISPTDLAKLQATRDAESATLARQQSEVTDLEGRLKNAEDAEAHAQEVADTVAAKSAASLTDASASTTGAGQFSAPVQRIELDKEATVQVAQSVQAMVTTVVNKDYTAADCMVLLTNVTTLGSLDDQHQKLLEGTLTQCTTLLNAKINSEIAKLTVSSFVNGDSSKKLADALAVNPTLKPRLEGWMQTNAPESTITQLIYGAENETLRQRVLQEFNIQ